MKILPALFAATLIGFTPASFADDTDKSQAAAVTAPKDVTPDDLATLMKGKAPLLVVDVRTPDEFAEGHIPGAKNVDFLGDDFEKEIAALPTDRPVIIHCAAGNRSSKAVAKIGALKLPVQVLHLKSGFNGWKAAGKPVEVVPSKK